MALCADDTVIDIALFGTHTGQEEIRVWVEGLMALNAEMKWEILQAAMTTLPETGGVAFPSHASVMALGGLGILGSLGLELLRRRLHQQG